MYTAQRRRYSLKLLRKAILVAIPVLMTACDPGVSIRQIKSQGQTTIGSNAPDSQVVLDVKTTLQLIGETWYAPEVRVTNSGRSPIIIKNIELAAIGKIYSNAPPRPETSPLNILPGSTETLHVLFRLDDAVYKVFKQPAELRVHYQSDGAQGIVHASVASGPGQEGRSRPPKFRE
jgi:hypothetical protein